MKLPLICVLVAGCAADSFSLDVTEQEARNPGGDGDGGCPVWGCGSNSPVIHAAEFWDLPETTGVANAQGFKITRFRKYVSGAWQTLQPDVVNGELVIKSPRTRATLYAGTSVAGAVFDIRNVNTNKDYELVVVSVSRTPFWALASNSAQHWTLSYHLMWRDPLEVDPTTGAAILHEVCGRNPDADGMTDFMAVLFDDDQIDAEGLRVIGERPNWFNIGCAGHALAKQHLTGHTKAAAASLGWTTTIAQRTANLKMITGDYCGVGAPFTVAGQPLLWRDEWNHYDTTTQQQLFMTKSLEARWTENGAACLNTPRVDFRTTTLGAQTFPDGVEPLLAPSAGWCTPEHPRPPPCAGSYTETQGAHTVSVNWRTLIIRL